jgi:hypothetical protein
MQITVTMTDEELKRYINGTTEDIGLDNKKIANALACEVFRFFPVREGRYGYYSDSLEAWNKVLPGICERIERLRPIVAREKLAAKGKKLTAPYEGRGGERRKEIDQLMLRALNLPNRRTIAGLTQDGWFKPGTARASLDRLIAQGLVVARWQSCGGYYGRNVFHLAK